MSRVIVIGAGASGCMAAAAAAQEGHDVLLLERNEKAGKKIYITGKGRCNLTNACDTAEFFSHVIRNPRFLYSAVYDFDAAAVMEFLTENGCPVKTERGSRVFPVSDHASDVTAALLRFLKRKKVKIRYNCRVKDLLTERQEDGVLRVRGVIALGQTRQEERIPADAVIVCTGGLSYPSTGSDGDGYRFAAQTGLEVLPAYPSLVPLTVREAWCTRLQGLSLKNVELTVRDGEKKKPLYSGFGEMLFTHFGISGPLVLTASALLSFPEEGKTYSASLNLKPALTKEQLVRRLNREIEAAAELIRNVPLTVTGTRGFAEAVVTRGGVSTKEIDPHTMEARNCRNLYFAGEVIDVDALTGGFNLQIAWSTGHLAGRSVR